MPMLVLRPMFWVRCNTPPTPEVKLPPRCEMCAPSIAEKDQRRAGTGEHHHVLGRIEDVIVRMCKGEVRRQGRQYTVADVGPVPQLADWVSP